MEEILAFLSPSTALEHIKHMPGLFHTFLYGYMEFVFQSLCLVCLTMLQKTYYKKLDVCVSVIASHWALSTLYGFLSVYYNTNKRQTDGNQTNILLYKATCMCLDVW